MAKRNVSKTNVVLESQKIQDIQEKTTLVLAKNTAALIKASEDIVKSIEEKTDALETLREDFIREENKMIEAREAHSLALAASSEEVEITTAKIIADTQEKNAKMLEEALKAKEKMMEEHSESQKRLSADHNFKILENARILKEQYLNNSKKYFEEYCESQMMAKISEQELNTIKMDLDKAKSDNEAEVAMAVNAAVKEVKDTAQITMLTLKADYDNRIAKMQPEIDSLIKELARAEERASEFKELINANLKAQVDMSANKATVVNVDAGSKK